MRTAPVKVTAKYVSRTSSNDSLYPMLPFITMKILKQEKRLCGPRL